MVAHEELFDHWAKAVQKRLGRDTKDWGLASRYECSKRLGPSHECLLREAADAGGFSWLEEERCYTPRDARKADGVLAHPRWRSARIRYELKSTYLPHYHSADDWHNDDFARLLRHGHPNGAIGDVERLRSAEEEVRGFVLIALSWAHDGHTLAEYERQRTALLDAFVVIARLEEPTRNYSVRGKKQPWSAEVSIWRIS